MNNQQINMFIGILLQEDRDRNFMRISRRILRDQLNPFEMPSTNFIQMFRLNQECVVNLINSLQPHIRETSIPMHTKVLATLHFLAVGSYQHAVGSCAWLSLSQTTICRIIAEICSAAAEHLLPIWVKFPTTIQAKNDVKQGFYTKFGFRGVLGAIDGTHVEILAPPQTDAEHPPFVYINREGRHSINVMLISDSNARIIGTSARFPGSVHDSAIWQVSGIKSYLRGEYEGGDKSSYLLGDSGYPLEPWLFTPFANPQNQQEEDFNRLHISTRNVIERTNGILKGRFRCLSRFRSLMYHPLKAANIIYTGCILHNMAIDARIQLEENEIEMPEENYINNHGGDIRMNDLLHLGREARAEYIRENL